MNIEKICKSALDALIAAYIEYEIVLFEAWQTWSYPWEHHIVHYVNVFLLNFALWSLDVGHFMY